MPDDEGVATLAAITVDYESLTIDEIDMLEETAGASLDEMMAGKVRTGKVLRAFALVAMRRTNPDANVGDAGKVTVDGLAGLLGEHPTGAAAPPASSPSAASARPPASRSNGSRA